MCTGAFLENFGFPMEKTTYHRKIIKFQREHVHSPAPPATSSAATAIILWNKEGMIWGWLEGGLSSQRAKALPGPKRTRGLNLTHRHVSVYVAVSGLGKGALLRCGCGTYSLRVRLAPPSQDGIGLALNTGQRSENCLRCSDRSDHSDRAQIRTPFNTVGRAHRCALETGGGAFGAAPPF